jgi:long-chain acyl-CoA synthetase
MTKFWLKSYPAGVPADIDPNQLLNLKDLLNHSATRYPHYTAFIQFGHSLTYRELDDASRSFAMWLQTSGFKKGDRIAIMLPNILQYPIAIFGALQAGLVVVNTNPLFTPPELQQQLVDSGATVILALDSFSQVVEKAIKDTQIRQVLITAVGDLLPFPKSWIVNFMVRRKRKHATTHLFPGACNFKQALKAVTRPSIQPVDLNPDDLAFIQYTGGTTGTPKGAQLTHANLCANVLQGHAWVSETLQEQGLLVTAIPLYHIYALELTLLFTYLAWSNVLIVNPRDFSAFVAELQKYPFAVISGVNTLLKALLNTPGFSKLDFSRLKITLAGGMAVDQTVAHHWHTVTGCTVTQAWGLTECSPAACINPPGSEFTGSIGLPIPSTEITIRNEDGNDLPIGQLGEICVRGPQVMRGYWHQPEETARVLSLNGWLRTGDIGRMDERGFVYLEDRKKDVIVVSGFKVYPNEVESVAMTHPGILEVAAVAQPDEHSGEVVALFAVRADSTVTEQGLIEHCRLALAAYKVPKHVHFRTDLPKTLVGKILKKSLREQLSRKPAPSTS